MAATTPKNTKTIGIEINTPVETAITALKIN